MLYVRIWKSVYLFLIIYLNWYSDMLWTLPARLQYFSIAEHLMMLMMMWALILKHKHINVKDDLRRFCCTNLFVPSIITTILCNLHNMLWKRIIAYVCCQSDAKFWYNNSFVSIAILFIFTSSILIFFPFVLYLCKVDIHV